MEIKVLNKEGKATTKKIKLNKNVFAIEPNDHAIYLDVKQYLVLKILYFVVVLERLVQDQKNMV